MPVSPSPAGDSLYSYKAWKSTDDEPFSWDLQAVLGSGQGPATGSMMLLAHQVDATFHNVDVMSLAACDGTPRTLTTFASGSGTVVVGPS